jgi:hypothetical protein
VRVSNITTLGRIIVAVLVVWFLLGLIALALFQSGGTTPPKRGQGTEIRP